MYKRKIIALSSAHGCGKTTQAYLLCARMRLAGHNVVVLDELARRCPLPINKESTGNTESWLISRQIAEELELVEKYDYIIVDRGVMDSYSYGKVLGLTAIDFYYHVITNHMTNYYNKIYVPHIDSFNYQVDDGTRDLDPTFRQEVFNTLLQSYNKYNIHYRIVHTPEEIYEDVDKITT